MGDVLWVEPVIRVFSSRYKKVIVYTKFAGIFKGYPLPNVYFTENIPWHVKLWLRIEAILGISWLGLNLDNSYEKQPKMHLLEAYFNKAGIPFKKQYPVLDWAASVTKMPEVKKYVVLHLSAKSARQNFRTVHGVDWNEISRFLLKRGYEIVEIGDPPGILPSFYRGSSFQELVDLIKNASFFMGIDSGPSHIAASIGTPALLFFGAINPAFRHFPSLFKGVIMQNNCEFAGCFHENPNAYLHHSCRLVGDNGFPKCCTFSTEAVIQQLLYIELTYSSPLNDH